MMKRVDCSQRVLPRAVICDEGNLLAAEGNLLAAEGILTCILPSSFMDSNTTSVFLD